MSYGVSSVLIAVTLSLLLVLPVLAYSEIAGYRHWDDDYNGVDALLSAQDPFLVNDGSCCTQPIADAMVILKQGACNGYIAAGNRKHQTSPGVWKIRPFHQYQKSNCGVGGSIYQFQNLLPANYYQYAIYPSGATATYVVRLKWGLNTRILNSGLYTGQVYYQEVGSGGQGLCAAGITCPIGYIASRQNKLLWAQSGGTWQSYCYTHVVNNVAFDGGTITNCSATDWTISYR